MVTAIVAASAGAFLALLFSAVRSVMEERGKRRSKALKSWRVLIGSWVAEAEMVRFGMFDLNTWPTKMDELVWMVYQRASRAIEISRDLALRERFVIDRLLPDILGDHVYDLALRIPYPSLDMLEDGKDSETAKALVLRSLEKTSDDKGGGERGIRLGMVGTLIWSEDQSRRQGSEFYERRAQDLKQLLHELELIRRPRRRDVLWELTEKRRSLAKQRAERRARFLDGSWLATERDL